MSYLREAYPEGARDFTLGESIWFALTSLTPQGGGECPKVKLRIINCTWKGYEAIFKVSVYCWCERSLIFLCSFNRHYLEEFWLLLIGSLLCSC